MNEVSSIHEEIIGFNHSKNLAKLLRSLDIDTGRTKE